MNTLMPEQAIPAPTLKELRALRDRADKLLKTLDRDLSSFWKEANLTFFRTPKTEPASGEINVTTTSSCVMALALAQRFKGFFADKEMPNRLMDKLIEAPWMSSGLRLNNAFTTSLVIRTLGFMREYELLEDQYRPKRKRWSLSSYSGSASELKRRLKAGRKDETADFIYRSLSDRTKRLLQQHDERTDDKALNDRLIDEIRRIAQAGWIRAKDRFPLAAQASPPLDATIYDVTAFNYTMMEKEFGDLLGGVAEQDIEAIAKALSSASENFAINKYPPSPAVVYWFVDGVARARLPLEGPAWKGLVDFANEEFSRQLSLLVAKKDLMIDPVATAMAACLCARLRELSYAGELGIEKSQFARLPSQVELEDGIRRAFDEMLPSGIWPKYFPMFHYEDQGAGSNYCFSFELLEAVLVEFGKDEFRLFEDRRFVERLARAVQWCEENRLDYAVEGGKKFAGWNSGGYITSLRENEPESWATAVVHMFLYELRLVLSRLLQRRIKEKYKVVEPSDIQRPGKVDELLDIRLFIRGEEERLSNVLKKYFVQPIRVGGKGRKLDELALRRGARLEKVSALLFGPPGTSKTEVTKAIAVESDWPLLTITPSDFVEGSLEEVYVKVDEVFRDMMDLAGVVIFFDEMDALMQSRERGNLDTATQFLTTVMLPKLAELHDNRKAMFFMATNHQNRFDPALKRAGRFDLLLCMGPPLLSEKLSKSQSFKRVKPLLSDKQIREAVKLIEKYRSDQEVEHQLELLTFAEFADLLERIVQQELWKSPKEDFDKVFGAFRKYAVLTLNELDAEVVRKIESGEKLSDAEKDSWIVRFYLDRKESSIH